MLEYLSNHHLSHHQLLKIENEEGLDEAQVYLTNFLKDKGEDITFANMIEEIHKFY